MHARGQIILLPPNKHLTMETQQTTMTFRLAAQSNTVCACKHYLMTWILFALLASQAAQVADAQLQAAGSLTHDTLFDEIHGDLDMGHVTDSINPHLAALLRHCLADATCSDAVGTAAAAAMEAREQGGGQPHQGDTLATIDGGSRIAAEAAAIGRQRLPVGRGSKDVFGISRGSGSEAHDDRLWLGDGGAAAVGGGGDLGHFGEAPNGSSDQLDGGDGDDVTSLSLKGLAAVVLFAEAVAGMYFPLLLQRLESPQWWLSLLNCFSGGIFLAAGIIHLLPHCAEAQEALGPIGPNGDYPLYLVLVVVGYCVVFYVERVLFDVHGEGHAHCQHSNVYSHSSYYKAMSHRAQRISRTESASAVQPGQLCGPDGVPLLLAAAGGSGHGSLHGNLPAEALAVACAAKAPVCGHRGEDAEAGLGLTAGGRHAHSPCVAEWERLGGVRPGLAEGALPPGPLDVTMATSMAVGVAAVGGVADDDAESCHSDHPPRAVCVCEEEQEAEAAAEKRARGGAPAPNHNHSHTHGHGHGHRHGRAEGADHHQHQHAARHRHLNHHRQHQEEEQQGGRSGSGPGSTGGASHAAVGVRGSSGDGADGEDQVRVPLLAADHVAAAAAAPPTLDCEGRDDQGAAASCDLRGLAWQHLHLQQQQQQPQHASLLVLPAHPPDTCAYHTHHHPHPHHRHRRRSAGTPSLGGGGGGTCDGSLPDSRASSCALLSQHPGIGAHGHGHGHGHWHSHGGQEPSVLGHPGHNHVGEHGHHAHGPHQHQHHHVIKPRFRFMHGVVLLAALALHTSLECIALGLIDDRAQFLLLFAAIASHKAVSALALSSRFLREGATLWQVTAYVGPFCLVAPLSVLLGMYVGRVAPIARLVFSCFATGTFLYVGASEVIMEEFEGEMRADRRDISTRAARYIKFAAVLAAVALVAASGLLPEPDHH